MQINYKTARALCTAAEFSLLEDTKPKTLTGFTTAELKRKATRARALADKWREQAKRQGNSTDGSGARSAQKHELFNEALARLEARLARITPAVPTTTKKAAAKKAPAKKTAAKKVAAKKVAKKAAKKSPEKKGPKLPAPGKGKRKTAPIALTAHAEQNAISTKRRLDTSGITTRIRGHVSSVGRRNQAARSTRKRSGFQDG